VAALFLADLENGGGRDYVPCPSGIVPAVRTPTMLGRSGRRQAFHLQSSAPVSAYSIYPFGGASSYEPTATLLLPVRPWDRRYVVVDAWPDSTHGSTTQIIATEADTEVTLRPTVDIAAAAGVDGAARGTPATWKLGPGEVLQFLQPEELTGSFLEASKPVA